MGTVGAYNWGTKCVRIQESQSKVGDIKLRSEGQVEVRCIGLEGSQTEKH